MTRLLRAYRARYHARRALTLTMRAVHHGLECDRLLDQPDGAGVETSTSAEPSTRPLPPPGRTVQHTFPAGTILLAALAGMVICTVWIALTWRASI